MHRNFKAIATTMLVTLILGLASSWSRADFILENYEFQGQAGNETSLSPINVLSGLNGLNFTESSVLTPSTGANSINASGWNLAGAYYQFGLTVQAGLTVTVDSIDLTTRSSGTGPGFLSLQASADGGAYVTVASITQTSTNYNDFPITLTSSVTASSSLIFRFVVANQTSANGGTIGSAGTFRVGDDNPNGSTTPPPFAVDGFVTSNAVPEPASIAMTALGSLGVAAFAGLHRKRLRAH